MRKSLLLISKSTVFLPVVFLSVSMCLAQETTNTWIGSTDTDWFTATNWSESVVPTNGQHVIIDSISSTTNVLLTNSTWDLVSFTITNRTLTFSNWSTTLTASNVTIQSFGKLTLPAAFTNGAMSNRVHIVCTNLTLEANGTINADYNGYAAYYGPGKATGLGGGGGYGGRGGLSVGGETYGSTNAPVEPGSGGSHGSGGGAIRVEATDVVTVYGTITANGQNSTDNTRGGGSGGGIFIICKEFAGSANGLLSANGGNSGQYGGGGGGGGRIAVIYNETAQTNRPGVRFSTAGGSSAYSSGEMGTLYLTNTLFLTETLANELFMNVKLFIPGFTNWALNSLTVTNCIVTFGNEGLRLSVTNDVLFVSGGAFGLSANSQLSCKNMTLDNGSFSLSSLDRGSNSTVNCSGNVTLTNGGSLYVYSGITNAANPDYGALVDIAGDVRLATNSWIYAYSDTTNGGSVMFRLNNLTIAAGGGFNADYNGYAAYYGPGKATGLGGGGGYGGRGGLSVGGETYGSTNAPVEPGSGGSHGSGGGAIRVEATDVVTVYGTITANGQNSTDNTRGGGSGGGIFIICKEFAGSANGLLSANGGNSGQFGGGGGGGGRIAVWYGVPENRWDGIQDGSNMKRVSIITNASDYAQFLGTVSVTNGTGGDPPGEPGTCTFLTVTPPSGTMFMAR